MTALQEKLFELQDEEYRKFNKSIVPGESIYELLGVRTPELRKIAKELAKSSELEGFLQALPHKYYEENQLHAFLLAEMKDFHRCMAELERFLPFVDNWATCDSIRPKCFAKHKAETLEHVRMWIRSEHCYTCRFAVDMLMTYFLDGDYSDEYPQMVTDIHSEEYYINMMRAWYFATALAKQYDAVLPYIEQKKLDTWTHNKAIQKAIESFRVSDEHKGYLRTLKIKKD